MSTGGDDLGPVLAAIDAANAEDPNQVVLGGVAGPKELLHGRRAHWWLVSLDPAPTAAQQLAARAHHFRRWTRPRAEYPPGRAGYLRWRRDAKAAHAADVAGLLARHGVDEATIERVGQLIRKEGLAGDPEVRTHEDALCLVFLEAQLGDVADRLGEEHTAAILSRTLQKMSPSGVAAAQGLALAPDAARLVARAVDTVAGRGDGER